MASRKRAAADLTGVRQRGSRYQVRIFGGIDPATGRQLILLGSATTEAEAIALRDSFHKQISKHTAVRANVMLRVLLAEWLAGHQVEPSTRASYALLIDTSVCTVVRALPDRIPCVSSAPFGGPVVPEV
jgi:integrase